MEEKDWEAGIELDRELHYDRDFYLEGYDAAEEGRPSDVPSKVYMYGEEAVDDWISGWNDSMDDQNYIQNGERG